MNKLIHIPSGKGKRLLKKKSAYLFVYWKIRQGFINNRSSQSISPEERREE
jgi:hypothetical protein